MEYPQSCPRRSTSPPVRPGGTAFASLQDRDHDPRPPYNSGLDTAPLLSPTLQPTVSAGDVLRAGGLDRRRVAIKNVPAPRRPRPHPRVRRRAADRRHGRVHKPARKRTTGSCAAISSTSARRASCAPSASRADRAKRGQTPFGALLTVRERIRPHRTGVGRLAVSEAARRCRAGRRAAVVGAAGAEAVESRGARRRFGDTCVAVARRSATRPPATALPRRTSLFVSSRGTSVVHSRRHPSCRRAGRRRCSGVEPGLRFAI